MMDMSVADVCAVLAIACPAEAGSRLCRGVSTDTRNIKPGDLYIALKGERFNGNLFANQALAQGAVAAIVDEEVAADSITSDGVVLRVDDALLALGQIAGWQRQRFSGTVLAVTGSCGKTSVKQLLAHVLGESVDVWMTPGNLNNHIGVPLTLLGLESNHDMAVIEQGASGAGEIAYTGQWVTPEIGIITNASESHLSGFGSLATIVETKGEIIDSVSPDGSVVLNRDDPAFDIWKQRVGGRKLITFGLNPNADVVAIDIEVTLQGSRFVLVIDDRKLTASLPLPGLHNVCNALAVIAAATAAGLSPETIVSALATASSVSGRMAEKNGVRGMVLLDDSYNANPASLRAAIDVITVAPDAWLAIGDMAELGEDAEIAHADIGRYAQQKGVSVLLATGPLSFHAVDAFGSSGAHWFEDHAALVAFVNQNAPDGTLLLIKGSRSAGMDTVVRALQKDPEE